MKIAFVILHYLTTTDTLACVDSILACRFPEQPSLVVVENGSPNNSLVLLREALASRPDVYLVESPQNLGFARGNNLGYQFAKQQLNAEMIILINNDTLIRQPDFLTRLLEHYQTDQFAIAGPDILAVKTGVHQNPIRLSGMTLKQIRTKLRQNHKETWIYRLHLDQLTRKTNKNPQKRRENKWAENKIEQVLLHGSCLILSPIYVLRFRGLFSETFMYGEEEILHFIASQENLKSIYYPDLQIIHLEDSATHAAFDLKKQQSSLRSRRKSLFKLKHESNSLLWLKKMHLNPRVYQQDLNPPHSRILIVGQHFWPETFRINEIAFSLVERGYQVDVLCGIPNYPKGEFYPGYSYFKPRREQFRGLTIYRAGEIPQTRKLGKLSISLNFLYFPIAGLFNLPRLWSNPYDQILIYAPSPIFMAFPGLVLGKLRKIPTCLYVLDYWPDSLYSVLNISVGAIRRLMKWTSFLQYRLADHLLTPSQGMKKRLIESAGIEPAKITYFPQSCESFYEQLDHDALLHERLNDRFNIVFAGNIGPAQNLGCLLPAIEQLRQESPELAFRFVLVGDGMARIELLKAIQSAGLEDYFVWEGHKPAFSIPSYHELADALLVTLSDRDLFNIMIPGKIQSYCAAGKPILAVLAGEGADLIRSHQLGYVSAPGDTNQLAENIKALILGSSSARQAMGEHGRILYDSEFRHDVVIDKLESILSQLKAGGHSHDV